VDRLVRLYISSSLRSAIFIKARRRPIFRLIALDGNYYPFAMTRLGNYMMAAFDADQCPSPPFDGSDERFAADLLQTATSTIWLS
jgi:hypothetical protein